MNNIIPFVGLAISVTNGIFVLDAICHHTIQLNHVLAVISLGFSGLGIACFLGWVVHSIFALKARKAREERLMIKIKPLLGRHPYV